MKSKLLFLLFVISLTDCSILSGVVIKKPVGDDVLVKWKPFPGRDPDGVWLNKDFVNSNKPTLTKMNFDGDYPVPEIQTNDGDIVKDVQQKFEAKESYKTYGVNKQESIERGTTDKPKINKVFVDKLEKNTDRVKKDDSIGRWIDDKFLFDDNLDSRTTLNRGFVDNDRKSMDLDVTDREFMNKQSTNRMVKDAVDYDKYFTTIRSVDVYNMDKYHMKKDKMDTNDYHAIDRDTLNKMRYYKDTTEGRRMDTGFFNRDLTNNRYMNGQDVNMYRMPNYDMDRHFVDSRPMNNRWMDRTSVHLDTPIHPMDYPNKYRSNMNFVDVPHRYGLNQDSIDTQWRNRDYLTQREPAVYRTNENRGMNMRDWTDKDSRQFKLMHPVNKELTNEDYGYDRWGYRDSLNKGTSNKYSMNMDNFNSNRMRGDFVNNDYMDKHFKNVGVVNKDVDRSMDKYLDEKRFNKDLGVKPSVYRTNENIDTNMKDWTDKDSRQLKLTHPLNKEFMNGDYGYDRLGYRDSLNKGTSNKYSMNMDNLDSNRMRGDFVNNDYMDKHLKNFDVVNKNVDRSMDKYSDDKRFNVDLINKDLDVKPSVDTEKINKDTTMDGDESKLDRKVVRTDYTHKIKHATEKTIVDLIQNYYD